jgi:SAM-dependent methyltransferase
MALVLRPGDEIIVRPAQFEEIMSLKVILFRIARKIARALELFSEAVISPEDLIELNHRFYAERVHHPSDDARRGLLDWEQELIESLPTLGCALACGCGTGREAIGLARLGFQVVGVDSVEAVVACARENARKASVQADFEVQDIFFHDPKEIEEEARAAELEIERVDFHHVQGGYALLTHAF